MNDIGKHVLEKIDKEKVKPYPRWYYILRQVVFWAVFSLAILFSGMATGVAIFQVKHLEWDVYQHLNHNAWEFIWLVAPYFWMIAILSGIGLGYHYFRKTRRGYKYRTLAVMAGSFLLSAGLGGLLAGTMLPEKLDTVFENNLPLYRWAEAPRHRMWMAPERGFLAGTITRVISETRLEIMDLNGRPWLVNLDDAVIRGNLDPAVHRRIKLMGRREGKGRFTATELRPFRGMCPRGGHGDCRRRRQGGHGPRFHGKPPQNCPFGPVNTPK